MTDTIPDIASLLVAGETETLEFKSSFDREAIESLVAFANAYHLAEYRRWKHVY